MNRNLVRSTVTVCVFWWIVLSAYGLVWRRYDWSYAWRSTTALLVLAGIGFCIGIVAVWAYIFTERRTQSELLAGESVRGLVCSIGELPLIAREPPQAGSLPNFTGLPDVPPEFFPSWFSRYATSHPAHVALMGALLRIYERHRDLPATHIAGGHGGRTLLQHSLLAGYYMDKLAHSWAYTGLRDRTGKRVVLKLRDDAYKFNANDPLIAIIGVGHDIGKIEAYIYDSADASAVVGIQHEHDLTGARMIARLPEAWAIPDEDRRALFLAIAHYHHPMELPLSPDRRAIDDRTIALMELLIKTDFVTSRIEAKGAEPTEREYEDAGKGAATDVTSDTLWTAFTELVNEHGRVNSPDPRFNIGTLCAGKGFSKPMLLLKEDALRPALIRRLTLPGSNPLGDGRHQLTIDLLKQLDEKGVLYKVHDAIEYSAENALWNVDFLTRAASGAQPEKKSGWSAVIVLDPKVFPTIEQADPYWWYAVIQRGTMGAARAINKSKGTGSAKNGKKKTGNLLDADDETVAKQLDQARAAFSARDTQQGAGGGPAAAGGADTASTSSASKGADSATSPSTAMPPLPTNPGNSTAGPTLDLSGPAPWEDNVEPAAAAEAQAPMEGSEPKGVAEAEPPNAEPTRSIAPIDVRRALAKAVEAAGKQGVALRELNDRYLVSSQTLKSLVPEIEWDACRYKIEQMSKAGTLEALFIGMPDGAYAVTFRKDISE